jgi:malate dehydrogenase (oxaloacetate-decarboxylating)(NADP+)
LAIYLTRPRRATDEMFIEAAKGLAGQVSSEQLKLGILYPPQSDILKVEVRTAERVAEFIFDNGLATVERPADIRSWIKGQLYHPQY